MGRVAGLLLLSFAVALCAAGCGGSAGYSTTAEQQFVAGCSKAADGQVAANLGTTERSAAETAAIRTYCRAALACLEQAVAPGQFAKASTALHDKTAMEPKTKAALAVCTRTASASTRLAAAFTHTYPLGARSQFLASCRASAARGFSRHRHGRLTAAQSGAIATYCGGSLACIVKAVTIDQFVAYDRALRAGDRGDRTVRRLVNGCAAGNLKALKAAFRRS